MTKLNSLTNKLGIRFPVIQGPFGGGLSSIDLVASVSNFGGLGSYGAHHLSPTEISALVADIKVATENPFSINLWVSNRDHMVESVSRSKFDDYLNSFSALFEQMNVAPPEYVDKYFENQVSAAISSKPAVISFVPNSSHKCNFQVSGTKMLLNN